VTTVATDDGWDIGPGWTHLVSDLDRAVHEIIPDLQVTQVKEKFGGLRYYYTVPTGTPPEAADEVFALVRKAEADSLHICEQCGAEGAYPGTDRPPGQGGGWILTLCKSHHKERQAKWESRSA